jgi:hypothetical protein
LGFGSVFGFGQSLPFDLEQVELPPDLHMSKERRYKKQIRSSADRLKTFQI